MEKFTIELHPYVENSWSIMVNVHRGEEFVVQWIFNAHLIDGNMVFDIEEEREHLNPPKAVLNFISETIKNR